MHRQLARVGYEGLAAHSDEIADVQQFLEYLIIKIFGQVVSAYVDLYPPRVVLQLEKRGAAHYAAAHHSPRYGHLSRIFRYLRGVGRDPEFRRRIGLHAHLAQLAQRLAPDLFLFAHSISNINVQISEIYL